jgi:hypothetical protein
MFHYTLARLETRQRKINDLHRAVANPFAAHCSSWVMASLATTRRVLMGHDWQNLAEWVRAIDELADMSDDEIEGLASATPEALPNAA